MIRQVHFFHAYWQYPPQAQHSAVKQLYLLSTVEEQIRETEVQIKAIIQETPTMKRLMMIPGLGMILVIMIAWEVGDVERFYGPNKLASYAETVPRVNASGGKFFTVPSVPM